MYFSECPLSRNFYVRTHVKSTRVNKTEAMYESPRVKVERGSTFSGTRDLPYSASVVFRRVKVRCVRMHVKIKRKSTLIQLGTVWTKKSVAAQTFYQNL